jgi:drug/metabolite transporter (DMT)-like permease
MPTLCVLGTVWLWSLIPLAVKVAYQSFNFGFIAFARMALGACVFAALDVAAGRGIRLPAPRGSEALPGPRWMGVRGWVLVAGLGIGGDLLLYTLALRYTTASAATLIVSMDGIILALLGVVVLKERMSPLKGAAGLMAIAGLVLVGWNGQDLSALVRSEYFLGNVIVIGAACCWATYGVGQRALARLPGGSLLPIFVLVTALAAALAFTRPVTHGPVTRAAVLAVLFLGLGGTGLAYVLLAKGMARLEAATVGVLSSTLPLFTMVEAHLLIGETVTWYLVAAAVLVMGGVALIMRHQRLYGAT